MESTVRQGVFWGTELGSAVQAQKTRRIQKDSEKRKERNRVAHSAPGAVKVKPARKKKVVAQVD